MPSTFDTASSKMTPLTRGALLMPLKSDRHYDAGCIVERTDNTTFGRKSVMDEMDVMRVHTMSSSSVDSLTSALLDHLSSLFSHVFRFCK